VESDMPLKSNAVSGYNADQWRVGNDQASMTIACRTGSGWGLRRVADITKDSKLGMQ
jgi:hypothetical protein